MVVSEPRLIDELMPAYPSVTTTLHELDPIAATLQGVDPRLMPTMRCGNCGFTVAGWDEAVNAAAHDGHRCSIPPPLAPVPTWHQSVFSPWTALIVFILCMTFAAIVKNAWIIP